MKIARRRLDEALQRQELSKVFNVNVLERELLGELRLTLQSELFRLVMAIDFTGWDDEDIPWSPAGEDLAGLDLDVPVGLADIERWLATEPCALAVDAGASLCPLRAPAGVLDLDTYVGAVAEHCPSMVLEAIPKLWSQPVVDDAVWAVLRTHQRAIVGRLAELGARSDWHQYLSRCPSDFVLAYLTALGDEMSEGDLELLLAQRGVGVPPSLLGRGYELIVGAVRGEPGLRLDLEILNRVQLRGLLEHAGPTEARTLIANIAARGFEHGLDTLADQVSHPDHGAVATLALALRGSDGQRAAKCSRGRNPSHLPSNLVHFMTLGPSTSAFGAPDAPDARREPHLLSSDTMAQVSPPAGRATVKDAIGTREFARHGLPADTWCDCLQVLSFCEITGELDMAYERAHKAGVLGVSNHPAALAGAVERLDWGLTLTRSGMRFDQHIWEILRWCNAPGEVFRHAASLSSFPAFSIDPKVIAEHLGPDTGLGAPPDPTAAVASAARDIIVGGASVADRVSLLGHQDTRDAAAHLAAVVLLSPDVDASAQAARLLRTRRTHAAEARRLLGIDVNLAPPPDFELRSVEAVVEILGERVRAVIGRSEVSGQINFENDAGTIALLSFEPGPRIGLQEVGALVGLDPAQFSGFWAYALANPHYDVISFVGRKAPTPRGPEAETICGVVGAFDVEEGHVRFISIAPAARFLPKLLTDLISMPASPCPSAWRAFDLAASPGGYWIGAWIPTPDRS